MSRNGSGTYNLPAGNPVVTGTTISSTWANNTLTDMANAITGSIAADGQTTITGALKGPNGTVAFAGVGQTKIPSGTTAQRAASPQDGMIRYNTDLMQYEGYKNGAWSIFGNGAGGTLFSDTVTATQGQTVIDTPTGFVPGGDNLSVYVNGSRQIYNVNYTETSSTQITFTNGLNVGDLVNYTIGASTSLSVNASSVLYNEGGTGAVDRNVEQKLQETVSVKDFGAVGDGVTDDTAAIQSAVDSLETNGGGTLYFPTGTYLLVGKNSPISNASRLVDGVTLTSNITIEGDGFSSIIKVDVNCANGFVFGRFRTAITTAAASINNVIIRNIQFKREATTFFEQQYQCWIDSAVNVLIENVYFNGWSGDAICIGAILNSDATAFLQSYTDNIRITNCTFDGVDKNNRQAVTLFSGTNISIYGNLIKNTTRSDMPGAFDAEPELSTNLIQNVSIYDNTFDNIGGSTGVICFALTANLATAAKDIFVYDNLIINSNNTYGFYCAGPTASTNVIPSNAPTNVNFENNVLHNLPGRMFIVSSVSLCKFSGNSFQGATSGALLAYTDEVGKFAPLVNFDFSNNIFTDCHIISVDTYTALITIPGKISGGTFSSNTFISSGRWSDSVTPASIEVIGISSTGLDSTYLTFVNNTVTTNGLAYSTSIPPFYCGGSLTSANTIAMVNNKFIGYVENGNALSLYTKTGNTAVTNGSASFQNLTAAPSNPKEGDIYYDSTTHKPYCWNGTTWNALF